jgi:GTP-binding protein YchF
MEVGIVGLPGAGKTTLFNALTGMHAEGFGEKVNVGIANAPDPRLDVIAQYIETKKIVPTSLRLVDIPGLPVGSDASKLSAMLEQVRQVDAICQVVRCFDDGSGTIDPAADIEAMETELVLADMVVADGAKDKATRTARSGDPDAKARLAVLETVAAELEEGRPVRARTGWTEKEQTILRGYGFVTAKAVLYVANIAEDDVEGGSAHAGQVAAAATERGGQSVAVCAKLEAELAELDEPDRDEMLSSLGLVEPAIGPLARSAHAALGLTTFYTAGEKEVRAWTIPIGATAPEAAGAIHSDIQRGFIRAEIREAGRLRSEGKHYELKDGDVVHFLFNV